MAATVASKPGLVPGTVPDPNSVPIAMTAMDAGGGASQQEGQGSEDAGPRVPPQHQRVKLSDFSLVRTLGTGMYTSDFYTVPFLQLFLRLPVSFRDRGVLARCALHALVLSLRVSSVYVGETKPTVTNTRAASVVCIRNFCPSLSCSSSCRKR